MICSSKRSATSSTGPNVTPPFVERATTTVSRSSCVTAIVLKGTSSMPSGRTTGKAPFGLPVVLDSDRSGPGEATVRRAPCPDLAGLPVEVGEVAAAAVGAPRPRVAGQPLLVVALCLVVRRGLRPAPGEAVGRAADEQPARVLVRTQRRDQPRAAQSRRTRRPGRSPGRSHARGSPSATICPASVEVAQPIPAAPPSTRRPDWKAVTIVEPTARLSGSTCVSCCAPARRSASRESCRLTISQSAATMSINSALTRSCPAPHATLSRARSKSTAMRSYPRLAEHDVPARPAVEEVGSGPPLDAIVAPESEDRVGAPGADQAVRPGGAGALGGMSRSEHHDCRGSDEAEHEAYRHVTVQGRRRTEAAEGFVGAIQG